LIELLLFQSGNSSSPWPGHSGQRAQGNDCCGAENGDHAENNDENEQAGF
jgi:hypothetical protein